MTGLSDWAGKRYATDEERRDGRTETIIAQNPRVRCASTSQCAAGYACVNGRCTRISSQAGVSSGDTAGNCSGGTSGSQSSCNDGSRACSDDGSCGSGTTVSSCCGQAVSYRVQDSEGKFVPTCDKPTTCRPFCSSYFANFGTIASGCEGYDPCFPDCEICGLQNGAFSCQKQLISEASPCYCDNGARCGPCDQCVTDNTSSNFGQCVSSSNVPETSRCQQCLTLDSYVCGGNDVGPITACTTPDATAQENLTAAIEEACKNVCDAPCNCHSDCPEGTFCTPDGCV